MNDFEQLSAIKVSQKIVVEPPKGEIRKIIDTLEKTHSLKNIFGRVRINFDPLAFRAESIDYQLLINTFKEKYDLKFEMPEIIKLALQKGGDISTEHFSKVFDSPEGLNFKHGIIHYEKDGDSYEVILRRVNIHSQNLTVALDGTTREAELVAQKIILDVLENQKLGASWSDFKRKIGGISYQSTSEIDLKFNPINLLAVEIIDFLSNDVDQHYFNEMADNPLDGPQFEPTDFISKTTLDQLKFKVAIFNKVSGHHNYFDILLNVSDRRYRGTGFVVITTEMKYEDHAKAINTLISQTNKALTRRST